MSAHAICVPTGAMTRAVAVPNRQAVRTTLMRIGGAQGSEIVSAAAGRARPSRSIPATVNRRNRPFTEGQTRRRVQALVTEPPEMGKSGRIALSRGNQGMGWRDSRGSIKYLTKAQFRALLRSIPKDNIRDRLLFNLMYLCGLRRGEAAIITLECLREGRIYIVRLKKGRSRWYDLFPSTRSLLRRYLAVRPSDGCRFLFRGRRTTCSPLSGRTIDELFRKYGAAAGLPPDLRHSHVLRHSIGVHMANEGLDIADVGDHLGHSDLTSTAIYFQVTDKRRAANFRRMLRSREIVHG